MKEYWLIKTTKGYEQMKLYIGKCKIIDKCKASSPSKAIDTFESRNNFKKLSIKNILTISESICCTDKIIIMEIKKALVN